MPTDPRFFTPGGTGGGMSSSGTYPGAGGANVPPYEQVTSIPAWFPTISEQEGRLENEYRNTNSMFDTGPYRRSVENQQSRVLTSSMNAGNAAAAAAASRSRQSGGSGLGADLIRAQLQVGAHAKAGEMDIEKEKFIAERRGAAATHAAAIATTLGGLRNDYLKTIADYAARQNATNAGYAVNQRNAATAEREVAIKAAAQAAADRRNSPLHYTINPNPSMGDHYNFRSANEATQYFQQHQGQQTAYGYVPPNYNPYGG